MDSPWLAARGLSPATLERYGCFEYRSDARRSPYNGRVMIRIQRFADGGTVGYLVRDQRTDAERNGAPKYLMPTGLHKGLELFGAWQLREDHKLPLRIVFLVESPLAITAFHQVGLPAVSPLGWSVSAQQLDIMCQLATGICFMPDADKRKEAQQYAGLIATRLWVRFPEMPVADPELLTRGQALSLARG